MISSTDTSALPLANRMTSCEQDEVHSAQLWWTRKQQRMSRQADICSHVKLSATPWPAPRIGFREPGGERFGKRVHRKFKVRTFDGHVAGNTWQVTEVKRPLTSIKRGLGDVNHVVDLCVTKDATSRIPSFHQHPNRESAATSSEKLDLILEHPRLQRCLLVRWIIFSSTLTVQESSVQLREKASTYPRGISVISVLREQTLKVVQEKLVSSCFVFLPEIPVHDGSLQFSNRPVDR